jgi:hypothetical protein
MKVKENNNDEIEYEFFCNGLEKQYKESKDNGMFEILKILELDETNSNCNLVQAINHFKENDGIVGQDAPLDFLTEFEKHILTKGEKFRSELYCMLLSKKFAESIENKSVFLQDSFKYSFDN